MNRRAVTIGISVIAVAIVIISLNALIPKSQPDGPISMLPAPTSTQRLRSIFAFVTTPVSTQVAGFDMKAEKPPTPTPHPEMIKRGQRLFYAMGCFYCHGIKAEGAVGPPLAGTWLSLDLVIQQVYGPQGDMPVFSQDALSESDVAAIYAYLQSLDQSMGPRPKIITNRLDSATGEALYLYFGCFGCHGNQGEGGFGPPLANTQLSLEELRTQVREPEGRMPAFGPALISDEELVHIQAFLKTLTP